MKKFSDNLSASYPFSLHAAPSVEKFPADLDVLITATTCLSGESLNLNVKNRDKPLLILAIGGDSLHKSELSHSLLSESLVIVEYLAQTKIEGETTSAMSVSSI